jgi:hypothetical protein
MRIVPGLPPARLRSVALGRAALPAVLLAALVAVAPSSVNAQSTTPWRTVRQEHLWVAAVVDQPITRRVAFLGDAQWRRTDGGAKPQQLLTRGTVTYRVTPGLRLGVGLNYVATAPYGEVPAARPLRDRQIFYLAQFNQKLGKLDVMHRYRFENRWLADVLEDAAGNDSLSDSRFAQRTRYLLRLQYPVARVTIAKQPVLAIVQNDLFVGLAGAERGASVDQNRISFGAGLPLSARHRVDVLWLQQWLAVPRARTNEQNGTLWLVLNHTGTAR